MSAEQRLEGRVALVTGAAGGLGRTLCEVFEREGAQVLPVDVQGDAFAADIGTEAGNRAAVDEAVRRFGHLDTLVLNAGLQFIAPVQEFPEEQWDRLNDVMVKGPYLAAKHAWPQLVASGAGRIVVTASVGSYVGDTHKAAYIAAKTGVLGLIRALAIEGAPHDITVNGVAPGWMRTPMVENQLADQARLRGVAPDEVIADMVGRQPIKRFVETAEVANVMAFLASGHASGITGVCVPVDLGYLVA
jgi:3-hydroxybutyrate dehydrogenase